MYDRLFDGLQEAANAALGPMSAEIIAAKKALNEELAAEAKAAEAVPKPDPYLHAYYTAEDIELAKKEYGAEMIKISQPSESMRAKISGLEVALLAANRAFWAQPSVIAKQRAILIGT